MVLLKSPGPPLSALFDCPVFCRTRSDLMMVSLTLFHVRESLLFVSWVAKSALLSSLSDCIVVVWFIYFSQYFLLMTQMYFFLKPANWVFGSFSSPYCNIKTKRMTTCISKDHAMLAPASLMLTHRENKHHDGGKLFNYVMQGGCSRE